MVSIHAFRGEGDRGGTGIAGSVREFQSTPSGGKATSAAALKTLRECGFNPRLPGGRRPPSFRFGRGVEMFQSTPSGGKATPLVRARHINDGEFQSTPSGGKATSRCRASSASRSFQSTPSGGKATQRVGQIVGVGVVSIHAFRGEGDRNI